VARLRNEVTDLGAVLDVALDRAVENVLWVSFTKIGLVPLWVAIVFLCRSFIVDSLRGVGLRQGKSVFGMMHSPGSRFLVASRLMRALYSFAKAWVFAQLLLTHALALHISPGDPHPPNREPYPHLRNAGSLPGARRPRSPRQPPLSPPGRPVVL